MHRRTPERLPSHGRPGPALLDTAGAGSFSDDSPLQHAWRDIGTASRHAALSVETSRELYGRVLLGRALPHTDVV
ncbi:hypothetical protein OG407_47285 [Streptomyces sp. NBC_01515]|uniref:hypothetical protein n=1 Tax=Streptomyces sp. NBC_01515 TaxID=2903890 RepID=UPI00386FEE5A